MNDPLVATLLVGAVRVYLGLGLLFALAFVSFGVKRVDPSASESSIGFRLVIVPGVALLWPLLASRWVRGTKTPVECNAHRLAAAAGAPRERRP